MPNSTQNFSANSSSCRGHWQIAFGLAMLIASGWLQGMLALTAMSLIALGATRVMIDRFGRNPAFPPLFVAHLAIYVALYFLFVGALWHSPVPNHLVAWGPSRSLDFVISAGVMATVARTSLAVLRQRIRGPHATRP